MAATSEQEEFEFRRRAEQERGSARPKSATRGQAGYAKARGEIAKTEATFGKLKTGYDDFVRRGAGSTGALDEVSGGMAFLGQGAKNIYRLATGQPVETTAGQAGLAQMDAEREWQAGYAKDHPTANIFATGLGMAASGRPTGAAMLRNPFAAGAAAAVQNAPFALARQQGSVTERLPGAALETGATMAAGSALAGAGNALARSGARARVRPPSPARQISRQGVDLTPGQMMGGTAQRVEDAMTSVPVVGDAIRGARVRGIESFNRAALNRSLAPIGTEVPAGVDVGRDGLRHAEQAISGAYDRALTGVTIGPDQQYAQEVAQIAATPNLTAAQQESLRTILGDLQGRFGQATDGRIWKVIDSDLGKAARAADNASATQPGGNILTGALRRLQTAHNDLLARVNPQAAQGVQAADAATANLARIRQASQYTGTSARNGVFTPADLNRSVQGMDTSAGNRAFARGDALMQDLTEPAMQVLPQTVPDSGTPLRSLVSAAGLTGGGLALGVNPQAAAVGAGAAVAAGTAYSRPAQAMLNAVYRASTPGQAREALARLAQEAGRDPAFAPYYRQALQAMSAERPVVVGVEPQ